jgi:DNA-binding transcriptional regulator LsrR (DeoR family)
MAACKYKSLAPLVQDLYSKGYTRNKIAEMIGVKSLAIQYILYNILGVNKNNPKYSLMEVLPKDQVNRIITLSCWGYNNYEIAEDLDLPVKNVTMIIKEARNKNLIQKFC